MSAFRYVSIASLVCLMYTVVVMIINIPSEYEEFIKKEDVSQPKPFNLDLNIFSAFSITIFILHSQSWLLPIQSDLVHPIKKNFSKISKVIDRVIIVDLLFYLALAIIGYISQLEYFDDFSKIVV